MRSIGKLLASIEINYHRLTVASRCCPAEAFASVVLFERSKSLKRPFHSAGAAGTCESYRSDCLVQALEAPKLIQNCELSYHWSLRSLHDLHIYLHISP